MQTTGLPNDAEQSPSTRKAVSYAGTKLIHELFEAQAERTPLAIAAIHDARSLTYAELNLKANQLARFLRERGVGPDQLVGICVERSLEMVIALLAALKAGGAYLPLDPRYPTERLQYMLEDAAPKVVLTQRSLRESLSALHAGVIELSPHLMEVIGNRDRNLAAEELGLTASNLLYVIYTSGSTGRPKGTAMPHASMANLLEWHRQELAIQTGQRSLQFAALSFDVAFQETFSTLCFGGTLVLIDELVRKDAKELIELLNRQCVERIFLPPLMLQSLAECVTETHKAPKYLKDIVAAGEQLRISPAIIELFKHLDGCRLHNHYGPTETHVVTSLTLSGSPEAWPTLPTIGRPIANTQIHILDSRLQPVPTETTGEIYISGANLARGYLNRPDLTAERFLRDPSGADAELRIYKTGDLGRWRTDGTIEYQGRTDDQVKIRGYRIELGEIEAQLVRHAHVREAAVIVREDSPGNRRLVAYVIQRNRMPLSTDELSTHLRRSLPEHMVPNAFVVLDCLPQTPNGKLDRRALPKPPERTHEQRVCEGPRGEVEEILATIWQELLRVERIDRHDNFFELGADSLTAMRLVGRVTAAFPINFRAHDVFRRPVLCDLAHLVQVQLEKQSTKHG